MDSKFYCLNCRTFGTLLRKRNAWHCSNCGWTGDVHICHPKTRDNAPAEMAGPEDAVCANHPGKKAVAACAGTGDYICSLCLVEIGGKSYSVQYLDGQGKTEGVLDFAKSMRRWDSLVALLCLGGMAVTILSPLFVLGMTWALYKSVRERSRNILYRHVAGNAVTWVVWDDRDRHHVRPVFQLLELCDPYGFSASGTGYRRR